MNHTKNANKITIKVAKTTALNAKSQSGAASVPTMQKAGDTQVGVPVPQMPPVQPTKK